MGFCTTAAKFTMIVLSVILWGFSAGCMFVAIKLFSFMGPVSGEILNKVIMVAPGVIMVVLAVLLFVIGLIGLCGAFEQGRCLQGTFCCVLLIIIGIEIAGVVCSVIFKDQVKDGLENSMNTALNKYQPGTPDGQAVDELQHALQCCGVTTYKDWYTTEWGSHHPFMVPTSCCKKSDPQGSCTGSILSPILHLINTDGCHKVLYDTIQQYLAVIIIVAIVLALIQVIGLVCACTLLFKTREVPYQIINSNAQFA